MGVRSRPMVWMTLRPHTHSPMQMPTPPYSNSQMGVGSLEVTLLLVYTSQRATKGPIALLVKKTNKKPRRGGKMLFTSQLSTCENQEGYAPHVVPTVGKGSKAGCEDLEELEENRDFWLVCIQPVLL